MLFCRWHVTGDLDTNYHNVLTGLQEAEVDLSTLYGFRCVKISKVCNQICSYFILIRIGKEKMV